MTVPLIVLAAFSVFVAWGIPPWEAHESMLAHQLEHSRPATVIVDFGKNVAGEAEMMAAGYHETAGGKTIRLRKVLPGAILGEIGVYAGSRRTARAACS